MPPSLQRGADRFVWIDMEMTGLDPIRCKIIEIATLVTDADLTLIAEGPSLTLHATEEDLQSLSDWSRETFTRTGLLARVRASTISRPEGEERTLAFLREHVSPQGAPLCGNSVWNDRMFLISGMPGLHEFLHYRNVDVSSFKEVIRRWHPAQYSPPAKKNKHDALSDIHESLEELRYYRDRFIAPRDG
jgi:oligoribonuclease